MIKVGIIYFVINIILNMVLVKYLAINGIIFSTIITYFMFSIHIMVLSYLTVFNSYKNIYKYIIPYLVIGFLPLLNLLADIKLSLVLLAILIIIFYNDIINYLNFIKKERK